MNLVPKKLATGMLRMDHTHVMTTFHQYHADASPKTRRALVKTICLALEVHARLEEEIFYPAMREVAESDRQAVDQSLAEHPVNDFGVSIHVRRRNIFIRTDVLMQPLDVFAG